jgi:hypothetical protein
MRVKKLISFYENQHFFSFRFVLNPKSLIERKFFSFLCLLCKDSEKLVHFGSFYKTTLFVHFLCYKTASILALASSTSELLMERR